MSGPQVITFGCRLILRFSKTDGLAAHLSGTGIGRHHYHYISKIRSFPRIIRQSCMVQYLKQDVK